MQKVFLATFLLLLVTCGIAYAVSGDGDVYASPPAADSAFVRLIDGKVGPYAAKPPGNGLETGKRYSSVQGLLLVEPDYDTRLKAQLVLINLSARPASLKAGTETVIAPVAPGTLDARAVNAVKADFSVYIEGEKVADIPPRALERGISYALVVRDGAEVIYGGSESPR